MQDRSQNRALYRDRFRPWLYAGVKALLIAFYRLVFRLRVVGRENVPKTGPLLIASNHASHLDPPAVGIMMPRPVRILAKQELFKVPVLGWLIYGLGAIPVTREGADRRAVETLAELLEKNNTLLIFPEGTRSPNGQLQEPKAGIGWLALRMPDAWILPVYVEGSYAAWPKWRKLPRPRPVTIHIGKPIMTSQVLKQINARTGEAPVTTGRKPGSQEEPGEEKPPSAPKKRLYWALAEEIMQRIATVQRGTCR